MSYTCAGYKEHDVAVRRYRGCYIPVQGYKEHYVAVWRYRGCYIPGYREHDVAVWRDRGCHIPVQDIKNMMWLCGDIEDVIYLCRI